jgi:CO/xanthine dehydrogenase FAD-binding subunit
MFVAARAEVELSSVRSVRGVPVEDFVLGHYETALEEDELITRVVVPRPSDRPPTASCAPDPRRTARPSRWQPSGATTG